MKPYKYLLALAAVVLFGLMGASTTSVITSGFFEGPINFKPDPDRKSALRYISPDLKPGAYTKAIFNPVEIWYAPDSPYKGIEPDQLAKITNRFYTAMVKAAHASKLLTDEPGPGVVLVRAAITNVKATRPKPKWYNYNPIGGIAYGIKRIGYHDIVLSDAVMELEMLDSETGKTLGALVDTGVGINIKGQKKRTWEDVEKTLEFYANRFHERMERTLKNPQQ
jgi:Protein of unknown function (DUF3313)